MSLLWSFNPTALIHVLNIYLRRIISLGAVKRI